MSQPTGNGEGMLQIPRIIHQTWRTRELPPFIGQCVESVRERHPGWEHRFYTDEDWRDLVEGNPFIDPKEFWRIPTGIQRADIVRMLALHRDGGAYLDVDILAVRSLDSLIASALDAGIVADDTELLLSTDHPVHCRVLYGGSEPIMNHFMIARPGAKLIELYLSKVMGKIADAKGNRDPVLTTGPLALTGMVEENGGDRELRLAIFPHFWTHPFPDMILPFPERAAFDEVILDGTWRSRFCPYFIHCWWHSYHSEHNMMGAYGAPLLRQLGSGRGMSPNGDEATSGASAADGSGAPMDERFPRVIWQVCAAVKDLPAEYARCRESWERLNPGWRIELVTNEESRRLFVEEFPEFLETFDALPLGVMKADMWRYAVVLRHGGFYADVDTYCLVPVESWLTHEAAAHLHICPEAGTPWFCQWAFCGPAGHPVLRAVLEVIKERVAADGGVDLERPECVHYYTSPDAWSEAIKRTLGVERASMSGPRELKAGGPDQTIVHPENYFDGPVVKHGYASCFWTGGDYVSWREDVRKRLIGNCGPRVKRLMELLVPRVAGGLKRFGGPWDGSFVLSGELLARSAYVLSLGNDERFDRELISGGVKVMAVESGKAMAPSTTIREMVEAGDARALAERGMDAPEPSGEFRFSMKMDVEGREYRLLRDCPEEIMERCLQLSLEFHNLPNGGSLNGYNLEESWEVREAVLCKILETHHPVHLHGNNHGGLLHGFPEVFECLFIHKREFGVDPPVSKWGCPREGLDWPCRVDVPDLSFDWWSGAIMKA